MPPPSPSPTAPPPAPTPTAAPNSDPNTSPSTPQTLPPPFLPTPSIPNLRSVGGYPCPLYPDSSSGGPGRTVRTGILYRSADPSGADAEARTLLRRLGVGTVFDLRSAPEIDAAAAAAAEAGGKGVDGEGAGGNEKAWWGEEGGEGEGEGAVERVWVPVFEAEDYSPERLAVRFRAYAGEGEEGFVRAYTDILSHAGPSYRTILRHLANLSPPPPPHSPTACLIHCTAGKDRTGVLTALLLSLLGVADGDIADEYALTEAGLAHRRDEVVAKLVAHPAFKGLGEEGRVRAGRMVGARKESMLATLEMIRRTYGGAEGYVRDVCGLSPEEVARIRDVMTVETGAAAAL